MTPTLRIIEDNPLSEPVSALLAEHLKHMREITPAGSVHAMDAQNLSSSSITFWSAWFGSSLAGCGALLALNKTDGEIKSMRTAPEFRRRGVASSLLAHIIGFARANAFERLFLETGAGPAFKPAHDLYLGSRFQYCRAFGSYEADGNSVYMTLDLASEPSSRSVNPKDGQ